MFVDFEAADGRASRGKLWCCMTSREWQRSMCGGEGHARRYCNISEVYSRNDGGLHGGGGIAPRSGFESTLV